MFHIDFLYDNPSPTCSSSSSKSAPTSLIESIHLAASCSFLLLLPIFPIFIDFSRELGLHMVSKIGIFRLDHWYVWSETLDWFVLWSLCWFSWVSMVFLEVFSNTKFQSHQSSLLFCFKVQLLLPCSATQKTIACMIQILVKMWESQNEPWFLIMHIWVGICMYSIFFKKMLTVPIFFL